MPKKKELEQHAEDLKESMIKATRECQEQQMCEIRGDQPVSENNQKRMQKYVKLFGHPYQLRTGQVGVPEEGYLLKPAEASLHSSGYARPNSYHVNMALGLACWRWFVAAALLATLHDIFGC